jgi:Flp pilus assembly protein TadG
MPRLHFSRRLRTRAFWQDRSGVAGIEFGFIAPLLLLMTFGTVEMSRALIVHQRFQRATANAGDLVTREKQLWPETKADASVTTSDSKATLHGIMMAVGHIIEPYSSAPLRVKVYQVWASLSDPKKTKIEWSYQYDFKTGQVKTEGCGTNKNVAAGLLVGSGRAVFVEASYEYTPFFDGLLPGIITKSTWNDTMIFIPRASYKGSTMTSVMYLPGLNNTGWDTASQNPNPCN